MALLRPFGSEPWREFDDLRRVMDAFFHRPRGGERYPAGLTGGWQGVNPPVNLYEDADAYLLVAELPGVEPNDIDISIEGSTITLRGERKIDYGDDANAHRIERLSGEFRRAFELPAAIDTDAVEASSRNGVLMLRLPKSPEHRPRRIDVKAS